MSKLCEKVVETICDKFTVGFYKKKRVIQIIGPAGVGNLRKVLEEVLRAELAELLNIYEDVEAKVVEGDGDEAQ